MKHKATSRLRHFVVAALVSVSTMVLPSCMAVPIYTIATGVAPRLLTPDLGKILQEETPIVSSSHDTFQTVEALPGEPFRPVQLTSGIKRNLREQMASSSDGSVLLPPGDYAIPVRLYCMKARASSPAGHRYLLAPLKGKMADVITLLNARATVSEIKRSEIQTLSWSIQAGMKYEEMPDRQKRIVDQLIPSKKEKLRRSLYENLEANWNQFAGFIPGMPRIPGVPALSGAIANSGEIGRFIREMRSVQDDIMRHSNNYESLARMLVPASSVQNTISYTQTPWSRVNESVYGRMTTKGSFSSPGELQLRVSSSSSGTAMARVEITSLVADPQDENIQPLSMTPQLVDIVPY